jgi:hypothetical protein
MARDPLPVKSLQSFTNAAETLQRDASDVEALITAEEKALRRFPIFVQVPTKRPPMQAAFVLA